MIKNVFIAGQKPLAESLFKLCLKHDLNITGCCAPVGDRHLRGIANSHGVDVISSIELAPAHLVGADIGLTAHYFGYIGGNLMNATKLGWLGYHPSILPLYKGKDSITNTVQSRDTVVGGSLYWLNESWDDGDIAYQGMMPARKSFYEGERAAQRLWVSHLAPLGLELFERAIIDLKRGVISRRPQLEFIE